MIGAQIRTVGIPPMPLLTSLARVVRLATLPETRGVIVAAAQSEAIRDVAHRAVNDRGALLRDVINRENARDLARGAAGHPATRELANAALMFLQVRYLPLGLAATWAAHRILRRYIDPATEVLDASAFGGGPTTTRWPARQPSQVPVAVDVPRLTNLP
jgi:hypothetical protein